VPLDDDALVVRSERRDGSASTLELEKQRLHVDNAERVEQARNLLRGTSVMFASVPARTFARILAHVFGAAALGLLTGCAGWARVQGGGAQDLQGRQGSSGGYAAIDGALGTKYLKGTGSGLRLALHMSADSILAPDRKSVGWGTGIVAYEEPRPISPYAIVGTSAHVDQIKDRLSFGNISPYAELGVRTSVPARYQDGGDGWFMSLGLGGATHFNYLVGGTDTIDGFLLLKLGVGWEKN